MKRHLGWMMAAAVLMSGCGMQQNSPALPAVGAAPMGALATRTLLDSFKHVHMAVFTKMDANADKVIDEYEASPGMELRDFGKADANRNGKLTVKEFMAYATDGGLFGFMRQDKNKFMRDTRNVLARDFARLDLNRDRLLQAEELDAKAWGKLKLTLSIDGLHTRVTIADIDSELFEASDRTKDGALGQAEFEDYVMNAFIGMINPNYNTGGEPPAPPAEDPAPPADEPATGSW